MRESKNIESILIACKDENDGGRYGREIIGRHERHGVVGSKLHYVCGAKYTRQLLVLIESISSRMPG